MSFDLPIRSFLSKAASGSPTPGGGSIAALSAAMGASMGSMVANLTQGSKFQDVKEQMVQLVEKMQAGIRESEQLMLRDIGSFQSYMDALGLPKGTSEEKTVRSEALQQAAINSAEVPYKLMQRCVEMMKILEDITDKANPNVISDLGIAILSLEAAAQSAWLTVEINLSSLKDEERRQAYQHSGEQLIQSAEAIKSRVMQRVRELI
nr:cyclodeaminase/cyclohydrolase family protein [Paenibacillus sp. FJAT-26967]